MRKRALSFVVAVCAVVSAHAQDAGTGAKLVDRAAGQPGLLAFDVKPGYYDYVLVPQGRETEDELKLRVRVEPPAGTAWSFGHWYPTAFLCVVPTVPDKASFCASLTMDASLLTFGRVRRITAEGKEVGSQMTSRQFPGDEAVELHLVRKGRKVTASVGGERLDEWEIPFEPGNWMIGSSTGVSRIEVLQEPDELLGPAEWPVTLEAAVADTIANLSEQRKYTLRSTRKSELAGWRVGWATDVRDRLGLMRGNDALRIDVCGQECGADVAAAKIIEAVWTTVREQAPAP
jgi:hypothetical protein